MARQRNPTKPAAPKKQKDIGPPVPFKPPPEVLQPLIETLDEKHVYILHVDGHPAAFKRKIFTVPVLMNVAIVVVMLWRLYYILPWYLALLASTLGYSNDTTLIAAEMEWNELVPEVARRALSMMLDFVLVRFLGPWPVEFAFGQKHGNPVGWRWNVGFRDREVVVRRSRSWDQRIRDVIKDENGRALFMANISVATAPLHLNEKTGYVLMNKEWDLDWGVMVDATTMVDKKMAALEAFRLVALVHQEEYGWLAVDLKQEDNAEEDERRRQVHMFRGALAALDKEDLFFRWIEIVQFESTQPGGFTPERQQDVAQQVRNLFQKNDVDFDGLWKESVGTDGLVGM